MITKKHFAWLPKKVTSGKLVWLDTYYENIQYYDLSSSGKPPINEYCFVYTETKYEMIIRLLTRENDRGI
jgi:hypothetical protein